MSDVYVITVPPSGCSCEIDRRRAAREADAALAVDLHGEVRRLRSCHVSVTVTVELGRRHRPDADLHRAFVAVRARQRQRFVPGSALASTAGSCSRSQTVARGPAKVNVPVEVHDCVRASLDQLEQRFGLSGISRISMPVAAERVLDRLREHRAGRNAARLADALQPERR